ncbi:MAG: fatty acid desaturase [Pseudobdellovibrionaceae bacterium]
MLQPPKYYEFEKNGVLYVPTKKELWSEFFFRMNIFADRIYGFKVASYSSPVRFGVLLSVFLFAYITWPTLLAGALYSFVWLPITGTAMYHRYGAHKAFVLKNKIWLFFVRNLMLKIPFEEIFIISHYLHHSIPDQPSDPYNPKAGYLYSFLADVNHQPIAKDLSELEYQKVAGLIEHTGVHANSYAQYLRFGSIVHPAKAVAHVVLNWSFWFGVFYFVGGGLALPMAIFGLSSVWAFRIRSINYLVHGGGETKHRDGSDFHRRDNSINLTLPGWLGGEWHNNHHMFPSGIRSGFLPSQPDMPYLFIKCLIALRAVSSFHDDTERFFQQIASKKVKTTNTEPIQNGDSLWL